MEGVIAGVFLGVFINDGSRWSGGR